MKDSTNISTPQEVELEVRNMPTVDESSASQLADDEQGDDESAVGDAVPQRLQTTLQDFIEKTTCKLEVALSQQLTSMADRIQSNHQELVQQIMELKEYHKQDNSNRSLKSLRPSHGSGGAVVHTASNESTKSGSKSKAAKSLDQRHTNELIRWDAYLDSNRHNPESPRAGNGTRMIVSADGSQKNTKSSAMPEEGTFAEVLPGIVHENSPRHRTKRPSFKVLRAHTREDIMKNVPSRVESDSNETTPCNVNKSSLRILIRFWSLCGVLPLNSSCFAIWYRRCMMVFLGAATLLSMSLLVTQPDSVYENIAHSSVAGCTLLCLACFTEASNLLGPSERVLLDHAASHGYLDEWAASGLMRLALVVGIWLLTTAISFVRLWSWSDHVALAALLARTLCNAVFFAFIHCLWQILSCLELMVDSYSLEFYDIMDCERGVALWNALQAHLRRAAEAVEHSFLFFQVAITATLVCGALRALELLRWNGKIHAAEDTGGSIMFYGEMLVMVMINMVIVAKGASTTEKCVRVPPFVNSVLLEPNKHIDEQRSYLVTYIANTHAGFYVKGIRLTFSILVRFCYLFGTVACGLGSAILSSTQSG